MEMNRHILATINVYLTARKMTTNPQLFEELTRKIRDKPSIAISHGGRMKAGRLQKIMERQLKLISAPPNHPSSPLDGGDFPHPDGSRNAGRR